MLCVQIVYQGYKNNSLHLVQKYSDLDICTQTSSVPSYSRVQLLYWKKSGLLLLLREIG